MKRLFLLSTLFLLTLSSIFFSCKKEEAEEAPELPPISGLEMDFSNFLQTKSASLEVASQWNYAAAVLNISFWNSIATFTTIIPITAFAESFNHDAVFIDDATWKWEYDIPLGEYTISARLEGQVLSDSVEWRMYLSYDGLISYEDFLWFEGHSALDRFGGWWILYESYASPNELLQIDWTYESDDIGTLKYTYVKPGEDGYGNYIMFEKYDLDENNFDRRYTIFNLAEDKSAIIEWNSETIVGRINNYNPDEWKCWDENFDDIICNY